jgi:hypothetical protein
MGLTIHYSLKSNARTMPHVRRLVAQLRHAACDFPFDEVEPLVEYEAVPGEAEDFPAGLFHATPFVGSDDQWQQLQPRRFVAFRIHPAAGCESAEFGLARYPRQAGWSWRAFCKTQYASAPQHGGISNFLRGHVGLIKLLDQAARLGLTVDVLDEGRYWDERDAQALAREIGQWNELVAGLGGTMKDALGDGVAGPIFQYTDFEHLEARGSDRIRKEH